MRSRQFSVLLCTLLLVLCSCGAVRAESLFELQLLKDFFGPKGLENRATLYTGEMAIRYSQRPTVGEVLPPDCTSTVRLLQEDDFQARYAVTVDFGERQQEWYAFLVRGVLGSKLAAIRTLQLPPFLLERQLPSLRQKSNRTPQEETQLQNLFFLTSSDSDLIAYLQEHLLTYEKIMELSVAEQKDDAATAVKAARLVSVAPWEENPEVTDIRLGSFLDAKVGLLHLPDKVLPPVPSPDGYFYLEQLAEHWFLYKSFRSTGVSTSPTP